jgi:hypothetical protein
MGTSTETGVQEIPIQYHDFKDVFEKKNADILLKHHPYDCTIELQDGVQPPFGPIYNLSQMELAALYEYIDENLSKNFIPHSKSPAGARLVYRDFVTRRDVTDLPVTTQ